MEKESFENEATAKILNDHFVSIKVDREERPDVDKLYMTFITAATGSGGWPMSVFLTPDLKPITGGTYFPPDDSHGMLGFPSILNLISQRWTSQKQNIVRQAGEIFEILQNSSETTPGDVKTVSTIFEDIFTLKQTAFDKKFSGFGKAPKFPKPADLDFLVAYATVGREESRELCIKMIQETLEAMTRGGIHDQIGKGFHRYSVDAEWHVPHFEKMLYDQAQLLATFSDFHVLTGRKLPEVEKSINSIIDYMKEALRHPEGGFYSAEDADSLPSESSTKKKEGAFCVWSYEEAKQASDLKDDEWTKFAEYFDIKEAGNVLPSSDPHGDLTGLNVLRRLKPDGEYSEGTLEIVRRGVQKLQEARRHRPKPHLDDKIIASWQGLAVTGLSKAYAATFDENLLKMASSCVEFIQKHLLKSDGCLKRAVYRGSSDEIVEGGPTNAFSDDYAFVVQGLLDYYTVSGDNKSADLALDLQTRLDTNFWDKEKNSGYLIGSGSGELKTVRMVEEQDGVEPAATSVAATNLLRLYDIFEKDELKDNAAKCFSAMAERLNKVALSLPKLSVACYRHQTGSKVIKIVGSLDGTFVKSARSKILKSTLLNTTIVYLNNKDAPVAQTPANKNILESQKEAVYICQNKTCSLPITNVDKL